MKRCALALAAIALAVASGAAAAGKPLTFVWPTSLDVEPSGSLLVVENGLHRLVRVDPKTGRVSELATSLPKAYAVARLRSGVIFVTDARELKWIDPSGAVKIVIELPEEIGPIAFAPNGDLYLATSKHVYRLAHGGPGSPVRTTDASFKAPHGIAVARDGAVLVSDTGNNRVQRIDAKTGAVTTLMKAAEPRGLDVAADGSIYVVEAGPKRVAHFSAVGKRLGFVGPRFGDPYDVDVGAAGVYVIDTSATGTIRRIARNGSVTTVSAR